MLLELPFVRPPLCPSVFLSVRLFVCRRPGRRFPSWQCMQVNLRAVTSSLASVGNTSTSIRLSPLLVTRRQASTPALILGTRLIQAPTDFLTLPNPSFFRSSLIQRGTKKTWICRPNQKVSPEPSKAQRKSLSRAHGQRKSAANPRKSAQIRPPFCKSAPFRPTRTLGKTMKIANPSGRQSPP